jgi:hypothetical protein
MVGRKRLVNISRELDPRLSTETEAMVSRNFTKKNRQVQQTRNTIRRTRVFMNDQKKRDCGAFR